MALATRYGTLYHQSTKQDGTPYTQTINCEHSGKRFPQNSLPELHLPQLRNQTKISLNRLQFQLKGFHHLLSSQPRQPKR